MKNITTFILLFFAIALQAQTVYKLPISGVKQFLGQANDAILEIRFATNNSSKTILKPLIVVEGFDSGIMGAENELGENDLSDFFRQVYSNGGFNLPVQMDTYDIIYINFNKGRDDLKRNAYLVEDIIKYVNAEKTSVGSTTPNVIIGQSMGGVIARYALRDMELLGQAHQTSLFVSHDAPQQGANIPLGILYFARHISKQFIKTPLGDMNINPSSSGGSVTIADLEALIDAPGTQQLLKNNVGSNYAINNDYNSAWQTELNNLGYPQQTRNIAISNGNHCATPQEFAPGAKLFSLSGYGKTTFLTDFLSTLLSPIINDVGYPTLRYLFNEPGLLIGILPGKSKFNLDFQVNALPNVGTTAQVYKGKISFTKTLLWIAPITINLTNKSFSSPSGILPLDYYPGGTYYVPFDFPSTSASSAFGSFGISSYLEPAFSFIPEPSALDIGRGNTTLDNSDYLKTYSASIPLIAPKDSPFANYTTSFTPNSSLNEEHISFNKRNGDWLASELNAINIGGTPQVFDCTYVCSDSQITGPDNFCTTANYSAPTGATTYTWSITQGANLVTLSGNGTANVTLTQIGSSNGQVILSLTLGDNGGKCGNLTATKTIVVGGDTTFTGYYVNNYGQNAELKNNQNYYVNLVQSYTNTTVYTPELPSSTWSLLYGSCNSWTQFPEGVGTLLLMNLPQSGDIVAFRLTYNNSCGISEYQDFWFTAVSSSSYMMSPNPTNSNLRVAVVDKTNTNQKTVGIDSQDIREINVVDKTGIIRIKQSYAKGTKQMEMDISALSPDVYIVNIFDGNQWTPLKLIKK